MPSGFSRKLMYGVEISSLSSRIAKWCEAAIGFCRPPLSAALSAPRWAISRVVSANALRPLSLNSIVTIGWPPVPPSKFCSGFLMSVPLRTGLSLMTHHWSISPRWSSGSRSSTARSTTIPSGTSRISALPVRFWVSRSSSHSLAALVRDAVVDRLVRLLVERVEEPRGGVVVVDLGRALRRALDRVVEAADRLLAAVDLLRVGPAILVEDVRLPVVEVHLRGRADLGGGALGVLLARKADVDLVAAGALQLRLGDAERVDAVAHDVDRAVQRVLVDRRLLLGRARLVDELDAALQVEPEPRRLRGDHHQRTRRAGPRP